MNSIDFSAEARRSEMAKSRCSLAVDKNEGSQAPDPGRRNPDNAESNSGVAHDSAGFVADSRMFAAWTLISRITGFGRVATMAAVFGPTYFGNLYQTSNYLPNFIVAVLGSSLVAAVLVPPLVKWIDIRDEISVRRVANGFLGVTTAVLSVVLILSVFGAPLLLTLLTAAVDDPQVRQRELQVGWPLLAMFLPQILLYSVVATGTAVQNAHGRFAIAAAAPALENLGTIAVLIASALLFGFGTDLDTVTTPQLVLLGMGSTAAVGMHAAVQWWGAHRLGVTLVPQAGWRDPEVRRLIWIAIRSSGYTTLYWLTTLGAAVVAGRIPGGVIAFQIGQNFSLLPVALSAYPLAAAQLPRLSRSFNERNEIAFHSLLSQGLDLARFVALPSGVLYVLMSETLARVVAFGQMANPAGVLMIAACITSLGPGVIGDAAVALSTTASYARRDSSIPLRAATVRAAVALTGMALALTAVDGIAILWMLGLSISAANLAAAAYFHRRLTRPLSAAPLHRSRHLISELAASVISIVPGMFIANMLKRAVGNPYYDIGVALAALSISATFYFAIQWLRGSSELKSLFSGIRMPKDPTRQCE
jgi:putative peptidoglycan lipid II flippase